ncbi:MAG: restriction endonuclease subunit S [Sulfuritalea sp.]|nr:restriction endonuclease subunit S [Sulfuritalea sp.]
MIDASKTTLKAIAEFRVGYPFRGAIEPVTDGSVAVVQMKDVSPMGALAWRAVVRTELTGRREPDWLVAGDLLFVARGNHYYAVALEAVPHGTVCGSHLYHLRLKRGSAVLPEFLAWQINQPPIQRLLRQAAEGSNQLSIRRAELEALPISVPPLAVQERIVGLAQTAARERTVLDKLILNRERQLSALAFALAEAADHPDN